MWPVLVRTFFSLSLLLLLLLPLLLDRVCVCVCWCYVCIWRKKSKFIHLPIFIFIHANERISTAIKLFTVYFTSLILWCRLVYMLIFFVTLFLSIDCLKMQIDIQIHFVSLHFISTNGFRYFSFTFGLFGSKHFCSTLFFTYFIHTNSLYR